MGLLGWLSRRAFFFFLSRVCKKKKKKANLDAKCGGALVGAVRGACDAGFLKKFCISMF